MKTAANLTFAERALREYSKGEIRKQRQIIYDLGSKLILNNKILSVYAEEPFQILAEATNRLPEISATFETAETPQNKRRTRSFDTVRPLWLTHWIDFVSVKWIAEVKYPEYMLATAKKLLALVNEKTEAVL